MKISPIKLIRDMKDKLIAVDFGNGMRAQHEHGYEPIKKALDVNSELEGFDKYAMQKFPINQFRFQSQEFKDELYYILEFDAIEALKPTRKKTLPCWIANMFKLETIEDCKFGINAAWGTDHFIIVAHKKYANDMNALFTAFTQKDILIGYSPIDQEFLGYIKQLMFAIKSKMISLPNRSPLNVDLSGSKSFNSIEAETFKTELEYEEVFNHGKPHPLEDISELESEELTNQDYNYQEYNDVGRYFAFIRHEIMVRNWTNLTRLGLPHFSSKAIYYTNSNDHSVHSNIGNMADCSRLDGIVHAFVLGEKIDTLLNEVELYKKFIKGEFWNDWTNYIRDILNGFQGTSEDIINSHLRSDLHYVYNVQYERMVERIGVNEFAKILGWDKRKVSSYKNKGNLPLPVQIISATPLWTVGQAENFKKVLEYRKNNTNCRGDWTTMASGPLQKFVLELIEDDIDPNERIYSFSNSERHYFYSNLMSITNPDLSLTEAVKTAEYVFKRTEFAPEIHQSIGRKYLEHDDLTNAFKHLNQAKQIYESAIPPNFQGRIYSDSESEYFFALSDLSYIYFVNKQPDVSKSLLSRIIELQDEMIDFSDVLDKLEHEPDQFVEWYKTEFLTPYTFEMFLQEARGKR